MTVTLVNLGDTHGNSRVALANPDTTLEEDNSPYGLSDGQKWLWDCMSDLVERVREIKKTSQIGVILGGDLIELDLRHRTYQTFSKNPETAREIAIGNLEPLLELADEAWGVRGSGFHVGELGHGDEGVVKNWGKSRKNPTGIVAKWSDTKTYTRQHLNLTIEGVKINVSHHTRMGLLPHTRRLFALRLASEMIMEYTEKRRDLPDIALRFHKHRWSDSGDHFPLRYLIHGCWCFPTNFVTAITSYEELGEIGASLIHIDSGKYEIEKVKYELKEKTWSKPNFLKNQSSKS